MKILEIAKKTSLSFNFLTSVFTSIFICCYIYGLNCEKHKVDRQYVVCFVDIAKTAWEGKNVKNTFTTGLKEFILIYYIIMWWVVVIFFILFLVNISYEHFSIAVNGEPKLHVSGDVVISSGVPVKNKDNMFFSTVLISDVMSDYKKYNDILDRKIDVFYRSSNCTDQREELVGIIRKTVEDAGFNFVVGGKCGGKGYPHESGDPNFYSMYTKCKECTDAKLMLAAENYNDDHIYLSEKFFLPITHGCIPLYIGNGDVFLQDQLNVNKNSYLTRKDYDSDQAFADAIVNLLKNPNKLKEMQRANPFTTMEGLNRIKFWANGPKQIGYWGAPELINYLRKTYPEFYNKDEITWKTGYNHLNDNVHYLGELLTLAFDRPARRVDEKEDVSFIFCC